MATTTIHLDRIDEAVIAYVEWHKHAQCVRLAYDAWLQSDPEDQACRFAAYLEELDREQCACEVYAAAASHSRGAGRPLDFRAL